MKKIIKGVKHMIRIRPFIPSDADTILSWPLDERGYYRWTAGMLGDYPPTKASFENLSGLMRFTATEGTEVVGFFTMRHPGEDLDELRFGYVVVDPDKRGRGYGKAMLQLGLRYAFEIYGAKRVGLGVFENNPSAYHCYKAVGFRDVALDAYRILDEDWKVLELTIDNKT